jgi:hypothetical protein
LKRHQLLLEEAGRLRRICRAWRVDIAYAYLTRRESGGDVAQRIAELDAWTSRAAELEQEALLAILPMCLGARDERAA